MATIEAVPIQRPLDDGREADGDPSVESGTLAVPRSDYVELTLPRRPASRRDLLDMLRETSPLDPARTAWSEPWVDGEGSVRVSLAKRDALDAMVGMVEDGRVRVDEVRTREGGSRFDYRTPAQRRRTAITALCIGGAAIVLLVGLYARASDEREGPQTSAVAIEATASLGSVFFERSLAGEIASLVAATDPVVRPSRIERRNDGAIVLTVPTGDPDGTREAIDAGGSLPGFFEGGQTQTAPGLYALAYARPASGLDAVSRRSDVLEAPNREGAEAQVRDLLATLPGSQRLRLGSASSSSQQSGLLVLPVELTGPQADVLLAAQRIEGAAPPMRFAEWSVELEGEGVRLSGVLHVPWQRTPS